MVGTNTLQLYGCSSIYGYYSMILQSLKENKNEQARKMFQLLSEDQQKRFSTFLKRAAKPKDLQMGLDATLIMLNDLHA